MKNKFTLCLLIFFSSLLYTDSIWATSVSDTILVNGVKRNFIVHTPPGYTPSNKYPIVLNFHGITSNGGQQETITGFDNIADTANFIVVYPNAVATAWNVPNNNARPNDSTFVAQLITYLIANYSANSSRIYATGYSEGALLCYNILAPKFQDRIVAIATVEANMLDSTKADFGAIMIPMPIMDFNGTSDSISLYNGDTNGGTLSTTSVPQTSFWWATKNNCNLTPIHTYFPNTVHTDSSRAEMYYYQPGADSCEVILIKIDSGGHTWAGSPFPFPRSLGHTCEDINASALIWNFFNKHTLRAPLSVQSLNIENDFTLFPNPSYGSVTIKSTQAATIKLISIYNTLGERVLITMPQKNQITGGINVDTHALPAGSYFLQINTQLGSCTKRFTKITL